MMKEKEYDPEKDPQNVPSLLLSSSGNKMKDSGDWFNIRRPEILNLFHKHVYGENIVNKKDIRVTNEAQMEKSVFSGQALCRQIRINLQTSLGQRSADILLYLPLWRNQKIPVFLGLNFFGNHTIIDDSDIYLTDSWLPNNQDFGIENHQATNKSRGVRSSRWPVKNLIKHGYGLASVYCGDFAPDHQEKYKDGLRSLFLSPRRNRLDTESGAIGIWAQGLSLIRDYLTSVSEIDEEKIMALGHSRLGKTALWAGAQDQKFALVFSNNSGCGGASLSRRKFGETITDINETFPHWFCKNYHCYNNREKELPLDQHMLLALIAPRPLYVASAAEDFWADPRGEFLSAKYACKVYQLLDKSGLELRQMPDIDSPVQEGELGYHLRSGGHDLTEYDWQQFLKFSDLHLEK